nr:MAG TPA: hypothetical protein [Caudoviricetes sp.]
MSYNTKPIGYKSYPVETIFDKCRNWFRTLTIQPQNWCWLYKVMICRVLISSNVRELGFVKSHLHCSSCKVSSYFSSSSCGTSRAATQLSFRLSSHLYSQLTTPPRSEGFLTFRFTPVREPSFIPQVNVAS